MTTNFPYERLRCQSWIRRTVNDTLDIRFRLQLMTPRVVSETPFRARRALNDGRLFWLSVTRLAGCL